METFSALLALCAGNSPVTGEFPAQRPVTPSFDVFFDLRLNKRLSKQPQGWWFETPSWSLWRQCNVLYSTIHVNKLKLRQNGRHFGDGIFKSYFNGNYCIFIHVQVMAWPQTDDKAFPEPILTQFTYSSLGKNQLTYLGQVTHIYVGALVRH